MLYLEECKKSKLDQRKVKFKILGWIRGNFNQALERRFEVQLLRHNEFLTNIFESKVLGKLGRGRAKKFQMKGAALYMRECHSIKVNFLCNLSIVWMNKFYTNWYVLNLYFRFYDSILLLQVLLIVFCLVSIAL